MHMKDAQEVDGVPLLLKAAATHGDTSDIHIKNEWQHETFIYHCSVSDSYCTATIYYSSAQRTGSDRHDECIVGERKEAIVYNNAHTNTNTCPQSMSIVHIWTLMMKRLSHRGTVDVYSLVPALRGLIERSTSERKTFKINTSH